MRSSNWFALGNKQFGPTWRSFSEIILLIFVRPFLIRCRVERVRDRRCDGKFCPRCMCVFVCVSMGGCTWRKQALVMQPYV